MPDCFLDPDTFELEPHCVSESGFVSRRRSPGNAARSRREPLQPDSAVGERRHFALLLATALTSTQL